MKHISILAGSIFLLTSAQPSEQAFPAPGQQLSFRRFYTGQHLAKHPGQLVTSLEVRIAKCISLKSCFGEYEMSIQAHLRNSSANWTGGGPCEKLVDKQNRSYLRCHILCDGGGFRFYSAGSENGIRHVMIYPDDSFRLRENDDERSNYFVRGSEAEHHEFLLFESRD